MYQVNHEDQEGLEDQEILNHQVNPFLQGNQVDQQDLFHLNGLVNQSHLLHLVDLNYQMDQQDLVDLGDQLGQEHLLNQQDLGSQSCLVDPKNQ